MGFSPNSQKITYMSYMTRNNPRVYIFDIETGQQEIVGEFPGMTFAPRFSPDGKKIIMSYSDPDIGNSEMDIFLSFNILLISPNNRFFDFWMSPILATKDSK